VVAAGGLVGWAFGLSLAAFVILVGSAVRSPAIMWMYDWHVYAAGGQGLLAGTLYREPLVFSGWPLPVAVFNLPPFMAAAAVPFLAVPDEVGGIMWMVLGVAAWGAAWIAGLRLVGVPQSWAWAGIAFGTYALVFPWFTPNVVLGNVNSLMLALIVAFAVADRGGRSTLSGVLLGLAIATKLWPLALFIPLLRRGRVRTIGWATGTAAVVTAAPLLWLGLDALRPMVESLATPVPIPPEVPVLWTTALRLTWEWWPTWGGFAVAVALLAIPARGLLGIGLAIVAGIAVIPNVWDHYLPTLIVGLLFVGSAIPMRRWLVEVWSTRQLGPLGEPVPVPVREDD
jgi:hypothetical protein